MVLVARYMTVHCQLGRFAIPCEYDIEDCPFCGEFYLEDHLIYDCVALRDVQDRPLDLGLPGIGDLRALLCQSSSRLGTFVRVVRDKFAALENS